MDSSPSRIPSARRQAGARADRIFFPAAGVILLAVVLVGFRHFYLHGLAYPGRPIAPPVEALVIVHGVTMAGWMVLFVVQTLLVTSRRVRLHMRLGWLSLGWCAAIVVSGLWLTVAATRIQPEGFTLFGLDGKQFTAVSMLNLVIFIGFIAVAVWKRKKPAIHRPMMLLATISVTPAALARIGPIVDVYRGTAWEGLLGPFLPTLVLGGLLLVVRCWILRSIDKWFAIGWVVLALESVGILWIATTGVWMRFAEWVVG